MRRNLLVCFLCFFVFYPLFAFIFAQQTYAVEPTPTDTPLTIGAGAVSPTPGVWVEDPNVTFVGKVASRSGSLLDWTLQNYGWVYVGSGETNPLVSFWVTIRNIVYVFLILFVLVTGFLIIITRGKSITVMRFIPQFMLMLILVTLSFALTQFLYQIVDIVQGFFLKSPSGATPFISQRDLLQISFDYKNFVGYRRFGFEFDESAFMSLLLVKLTAITYYSMIGVLLIRKIILWFFLIISPVFAVLLMYFPLRNTGKIWMGEFFRWLLYGPIFAIFLAGVVFVWRAGIPLQFHGFNGAGSEGSVIFPTAVNILLGGPGQQVSLNNSLNTPETFAQYIVALLMLWIVILLPFLLLQILLDYMRTSFLTEHVPIQQFLNGGSSFFTNKLGAPPVAPTPVSPSPPSQSAGMVRSLPFAKRLNIENIQESNTREVTTKTSLAQPAMQSYGQSSFQAGKNKRVQDQADVLRLTNLTIPTMRDIAKYETALISRQSIDHEKITKIEQTLREIAQPENVVLPANRQQAISLKAQLVEQSKQGSAAATAVLSAAQSAVGGGVTSLSSSSVQQGVSQSKNVVSLPAVNTLQSVSLDDYESVKKLWKENYEKLDPSENKEGKKDRKAWIEDDIKNIEHAINLLTTNDPAKVKEGMNVVGKMLPFLLMGGFSQTEIIAYLKSKIEAGKAVLSEMSNKENEEDTLLDVEKKKDEQKKVMHAEAEAEVPETTPKETTQKTDL